jgi:cell division protein FtsB
MVDRLRNLRSWQLLVVTSLVVLLPLMADLHGRLALLRRMRQEEIRVTRELERLRSEQTTLRAQLEFVREEAYVERWARVELRMTRPGEVGLIPIYQRQPQEVPSTDTASVVAGDSYFDIPEQWRQLFFSEATGR